MLDNAGPGESSEDVDWFGIATRVLQPANLGFWGTGVSPFPVGDKMSPLLS